MQARTDSTEQAVALATQFLTRVWGPAHDLDAIDELMSENYRIWSGGKLVAGRAAFKDWVRQFQLNYGNAHTEIQDLRQRHRRVSSRQSVVARWLNTGINQGVFGLPPDGRPVSFTGIAI